MPCSARFQRRKLSSERAEPLPRFTINGHGWALTTGEPRGTRGSHETPPNIPSSTVAADVHCSRCQQHHRHSGEATAAIARIPPAADKSGGMGEREAEAMKRFTVITEGNDRFGLAKLAEAYVDDQWLADHMTPEQATEAMMEQFRRALLQELELIEVRCEEVTVRPID
jgi:hypothetical protein